MTLVVCGAPLAERAHEVVGALAGTWSVSVVVTAAARQWCSLESSPDRPRPRLVVVCPLTFNTANKTAAGVMDTPAAGVLCDAIGAGVPVVGVPMVNDRLWGHPVWPTTLRALDGAGVRLVDLRSGRLGQPQPVRSGTGPAAVAAFDPQWLLAALA